MTYFDTKTCEERLLESLLWNFGKIRQVNDYKTDLGDTFIEIPQRKDIKVWPAVALNHEITRPYNDPFGQQVNSFNSISYWSTFSVLVFHLASDALVNTPEKRRAWRAKVTADISKLLMDNAGLISEEGEQTAFTVVMGEHKGFDRLEDEAYVGQAIRFHVRWGHDTQDPTVFTF